MSQLLQDDPCRADDLVDDVCRCPACQPPAQKTDYVELPDMQAWARGRMQARLPDYIIGDPERPYMRRWWIVPRSEGPNNYLHEILRSDDDRALHDHPWDNTSYLLEGSYIEVTPQGEFLREAGSIVHRKATDAHRIIIPAGGRAVSLFFTGPKVREWGFFCPQGWRHWRDFTAGQNGELVGRGCE